MTCEHVPQLPDPAPEPPQPLSCMDCAELDQKMWAHLRMCLTCGHVACCDSSPHRHATVHYYRSDHPVMRSVEPGEDWRWCYSDHRLV
ncbi:MAG: UBP-type zinc finger domain-containing protein [Pseudonocardiaceae bacterium]